MLWASLPLRPHLLSLSSSLSPSWDFPSFLLLFSLLPSAPCLFLYCSLQLFSQFFILPSLHSPAPQLGDSDGVTEPQNEVSQTGEAGLEPRAPHPPPYPSPLQGGEEGEQAGKGRAPSSEAVKTSSPYANAQSPQPPKETFNLKSSALAIQMQILGKLCRPCLPPTSPAKGHL